MLTRNEALAAVTVPCGLMKAAFSLAICSAVDTRIPLSLDTEVARPEIRTRHVVGWKTHGKTLEINTWKCHTQTKQDIGPTSLGRVITWNVMIFS